MRSRVIYIAILSRLYRDRKTRFTTTEGLNKSQQQAYAILVYLAVGIKLPIVGVGEYCCNAFGGETLEVLRMPAVCREGSVLMLILRVLAARRTLGVPKYTCMCCGWYRYVALPNCTTIYEVYTINSGTKLLMPVAFLRTNVKRVLVHTVNINT